MNGNQTPRGCMTKSKPALSPLAPVELQSLQTTSGKASSRQAVILDPRGEAIEVGIVSINYKLVKNGDVVQVAEGCPRNKYYDSHESYSRDQPSPSTVCTHPDAPGANGEVTSTLL